MICPVCLAPTDPTDRYCSACGAELSLVLGLVAWRAIVDRQANTSPAAPAAQVPTDESATETRPTPADPLDDPDGDQSSTKSPPDTIPAVLAVPSGLEWRLYAVTDSHLLTIDLATGAVTAAAIDDHPDIEQLMALRCGLIGSAAPCGPTGSAGLVRLSYNGTEVRSLADDIGLNDEPPRTLIAWDDKEILISVQVPERTTLE